MGSTIGNNFSIFRGRDTVSNKILSLDWDYTDIFVALLLLLPDIHIETLTLQIHAPIRPFNKNRSLTRFFFHTQDLNSKLVIKGGGSHSHPP